jgi:hypothetical protein
LWTLIYEDVMDSGTIANIGHCETVRYRSETLLKLTIDSIQIEFAVIKNGQVLGLASCNLANELAADTTTGTGNQNTATFD